MGANFEYKTLAGDLDRAAVRIEFEGMQASDRYENGHSYSGGFGMASGLQFPAVTALASVLEANSWLQENAQKWDAALAVRAKDLAPTTWRGEPSPTFNTEVWVIGAWCAS